MDRQLHPQVDQQPDRPAAASRGIAGSAGANPVLDLQQTIGNRAVGRLLQAKRRVSQPGDPDEHEANRASDYVMGVLDADAVPAQSAARSAVQRQVSAQPAASALLVDEDRADRTPGQMTKSEFLSKTRTAVCEAAEAVLSGSGQSTSRCPYLGLVFTFLERRDPAYIERTLRNMAPDLRNATTAADYIPLIVERVRASTRHWMRTGEIVGVPQGVPTSFLLAGAPEKPPAQEPAGVVQTKAELDQPHPGTNAETILEQLGEGRALESSVASRMGSAFGADFSHVRMHDDQRGAELSADLDARAFTVGEHVAFGAGEYQPGTLTGDALIAHELAHTIQQGAAGSSPATSDGTTETRALEEEADSSAAGTVMRLWRGMTGSLTGIAQNVGPALRSGLQLQRCEYVRAPTNLDTAAAKSAWIEQAIKKDVSGTSQAIVDIFKGAATTKEFLDIQKGLDMPAVIDYLRLWDAVQLGALGPMVAGADKLNKKRFEYIVKATLEYGPYAEVFTHYIFNTMYTDDMREVLRLLADDKRLAQTVLRMDAVKDIINERGIKLSDYKDRDESLGYVVRGVGQALDDLMATAPASSRGASAYSEKLELPEGYQKLFDAVSDQLLKEATSPGRVAFGTFDYLAFGIPGGIYGLVSGTIHGIGSVREGKYEQAAHELTGASIVLLSFLGVRAYRAATSPKTVMGPAGPGQFVIKGFTGPIRPEVARLGAILELNGEAQAAAGVLFAEIGRKGVVNVARLVQADSKAALLVYEHGVPAIRALHKTGDAAKAAALLPAKPTPVAAQAWAEGGLAGHGYVPDRIFMDWVPGPIPAEGWKLHVSADAASAAAVADAVLPQLRAMNVNHKVVGSAEGLAKMGGTQKGKFITIYPESVAHAKAITDALDGVLAGKGLTGPVISGEGAVGSSGLIYTRYGGFTKSTVTNPAGKEVSDNQFRGSLKPPWIEDPWAAKTPTTPPPAGGQGSGTPSEE